MTRLFLTVIIAGTCTLLQAQTSIENVKFKQAGNNIVVTYDLYCNGNFDAQLFYTTNNGASWHGPLKSVTGDVNNVRQGTGKSITWDVLKDQGWLISDNIKFKVAEEPKNGTFTDSRDNQTYKWVKIGNQKWMAENLNYQTSESWCYDDNSSNCGQYGRLYTYETAKNVCPAGWYLPTKQEFESLLNNFGGEGNSAYVALKEGGNSGFNALFGGTRCSDGDYDYRGSRGYFWSSSEYLSNYAWYMRITSYRKKASMYYGLSRSWGFSVRCLQD